MTIPNLERLGIPGVIGLGLLLFCLPFYLGSIAPAQSELSALQREAGQLGATAARSAQASGSTAAPAAGAEPLPSIATFPELLKELTSLAERDGVVIDRASYVLSDREGQRLMEISLPLKAGYPLLRTYLHDVLTLKRSPSLDELTFKRPQASDPAVEANIRLSYQLAPTS